MRERSFRLVGVPEPAAGGSPHDGASGRRLPHRHLSRSWSQMWSATLSWSPKMSPR